MQTHWISRLAASGKFMVTPAHRQAGTGVPLPSAGRVAAVYIGQGTRGASVLPAAAISAAMR